jgi:lipopolysaccharide cholinephosphotransferase
MEFSSLDKVQYRKLLLKTYSAFSCFCKDNNIHFCAAGGTMLGAVRHKAMIPWDDDIDVYMMRSDFDKFISIREKLNETEYEILDLHTEGYYCSHTKFSHKSSSIWEFQGIPFIMGAFIDIFVLDYESGSYENLRKKRQEYARFYNLYFISSNNPPFAKIFDSVCHLHFKKAFWYLVQKFLFKIVRPQIRNKMLIHSEDKIGEWLIAYTGTSGVKDIFRSEWFEKYISFPFEDTKIDVPCGYVSYLEAMYGDYLTIPPIEKRKTHHSLFYYNLDRRITSEEMAKMQLM